MKQFHGLSLPALFCVVALLIIGAGCSPTSSEVVDSENSSESFQANPQPVAEVDVKTLEIGTSAPDFRLPGADGRFYELADFDDSQVLVIIFTCNHCPTAQAYEERIKAVVADYEDRSVAVLAISPNSPLGLLLEELGYSDMGDTYEDNRTRAKDHAFNFPYLYDGDDQQVSIRYGPAATPHAFVFDAERKLRYVGRLDGSEKPGTANAEDLRQAIDAILSGGQVAKPVTKSFGCSTKWAWKLEWKEKANQEWGELPVTLEDIDESGIKDLIRNDSEKLRLINVWATWCGPCVIEFPELIDIHRMYKGRDFEFVSLSADSLENREDVLKFLEEKESAVTNFIFDKGDPYALIEAIDPDWNGALPYTILVEPGGKSVYAKQGMIDPLELKRIIVDHPMIGRYY